MISYLEVEIALARRQAVENKNGSRSWWLARLSGLEFALIACKEAA